MADRQTMVQGGWPQDADDIIENADEHISRLTSIVLSAIEAELRWLGQQGFGITEPLLNDLRRAALERAFCEALAIQEKG